MKDIMQLCTNDHQNFRGSSLFCMGDVGPPVNSVTMLMANYTSFGMKWLII